MNRRKRTYGIENTATPSAQILGISEGSRHTGKLQINCRYGASGLWGLTQADGGDPQSTDPAPGDTGYG